MNRLPACLRLPICCQRSAFDALAATLPDIDAPHGLLPAAIAVARHSQTPADLADVEERVSELARTVASRACGTQVQSVIAHLHEYLFDDLVFEGNNDDYYNPLNSLLPSVLRTHKGVPISLSLVYKLVGDRVGLRIWGVGLPGHFLTGLDYNGTTAWVDAFLGGRLITLDEAKARVAARFVDRIEWSDRLMEPVRNRYWITRMLQNLLSCYTRSADYSMLSSVLEMEVLLWPGEPRLHRDLAMVLGRLGRSELASAWLEHYLSTNPDDPQGADLRQVLANLA